MLRVEKKLPGYQPLCYIKSGLLLAYGNKIYRCDLKLDNIEYLCELPISFRNRCFSKIRILSRIFRIYVRCALNVQDKFVILVCADKIWRISLDSFEVTLDFVIPDNRTALYLTLLKGREGQEDRVVFGEYFNNPHMSAVKVWAVGVSGESNWHVLHEFKSNEINHVHNIISSEQNDDCYILTGDFENGAAIWKTNSNFETVVALVRGKQSHRACWAIVDSKGLTYATDTQLELNSLCKVIDGQVIVSEQIEGSSIYFGKNRNKYYFSTTVEPDEPSGNFLRDVFSYKLGRGILSNRSRIYSVDGEDNFNSEFLGVKDFIPTRLGQFGSFNFPSGVMLGEGIIAYGVALKAYDGCCLLLSDDG